MKKEFYRSYMSFEMYPVTIHCKGMKCGKATILSAGFDSFDCDQHRVSAYVTLKNGDMHIAKRLLEYLDEHKNFARMSAVEEAMYGPLEF